MQSQRGKAFRLRLKPYRNWIQASMAAAERFAHQPPRAHRKKCVKMPMISRAQRSAAWACSARWSLVPICCPHDRTTPARNHLARRAFIGITPSTRSASPQRAVSTTDVRPTPAPRATARRNRHHGRSPRRRVVHEKGIADHAATAAERLGVQLPQARQRMTSKKARSRARSGRAACACWSAPDR